MERSLRLSNFENHIRSVSSYIVKLIQNQFESLFQRHYEMCNKYPVKCTNVKCDEIFSRDEVNKFTVIKKKKLRIIFFS